MGSKGDSTEARVVSGGEEGGVNVNIRCSNGSKFTVKTSLDSTVAVFKEALSRTCDVPAEQQRLIYKGRILKDDQTLESYGLQADHTVHMVRGLPGATTTPPPAAPNSGISNNAPGVTRGVGSNEGGGAAAPGASLFGLGGLNPLGGGGGASLFRSAPELEQVHQQLAQNPNMMRDLMSMPAMQSLLENPELLRSMIMSNPQMRDLIDRNPELGHVLNDPSLIRQTLEAARNPEIMREMMRNTDRAMSNIEASPEGFNMLRRMYENVQEPFQNLTAMGGGNNRNDSASNPFAALLGNQGGTQVRDGNNNTPGTGTGTGSDSVPAVPNTNPLPNPWGSAGGGGAQTNTTARSTATGEARAPGAAGLGGLGLPGMEQMFGGIPDTNTMNQLMQNPAISQMMQTMLSNPQFMNQMLNHNPQLRGLLDLPQMREMMQNPELLRQLSSPETMQQMLAMQQSLMSQLNRSQTTREGGQAGGATAGLPNNNSLNLLMNMFGGLGTGGFGAPPINPDVPPEELYATQLAQLQEMGFFDTQENIRALRATSGNVHAAVDRLLGNPGL